MGIPGVFVSGAERHPKIVALGVGSNKPEELGADILWAVPATSDHAAGWVGVQRKEIADLVASVLDGRLGKELGQLTQCAIAMVVVEGRVEFTADGEMMGSGARGVAYGGKPWTRAQFNGVLWSLQNRGVWVTRTADAAETAEVVGQFVAWTRKREHVSLLKRGAVEAPWGKPGSRDYARHLLMGLEGIGWELANRIIDKFGGVPWTWTVTEKELREVEGIGKVKAAKMMAALGTGMSPAPSVASPSSSATGEP